MDKAYLMKRIMFITIIPVFLLAISDYECKKTDEAWYGLYSGYTKYIKAGDIIMAYTSLSLSVDKAERMINECNMSYWSKKFPGENKSGEYWKNDMMILVKKTKKELQDFINTKNKMEKTTPCQNSQPRAQ